MKGIFRSSATSFRREPFRHLTLTDAPHCLRAERIPTPTPRGGWCMVWLAVSFGSAVCHAQAPLTPEQRVANAGQRIDQAFQAESGKPLRRASKQPPLRPGRANYVRAYSFSMIGFAARCLYLNEMLDEANAALAENAQHYLDNPKDIPDRDSFHWHADIVMRLIEMYGPNGTVHPGRLTAETEALCLKPIWIYVKTSSSLAKAETTKSKTWSLYSTENHHAMDFTVDWQFAKIARDKPEYRTLRCDDGATLEDHYRAWNDYFVVYCLERARKGPCIEIMCPGYNAAWLKGFYNFRDFGEPKVRQAAEMLLDLYWAYWAQEQLNGVDGGGKTRIRGVKGFSHDTHGIPALGWLYFGLGEKPTAFTVEVNAMLSNYRPPEVVAEIAHSAREHGPFEIRQRAQGLGEQADPESETMNSDMAPNTFRTDGGGIVRYSYCDPAFTIGTLLTEARPLGDWVSISAQSRWQGVVFSDNPEARIVALVRPEGKARDVLNGHWSVQNRGCLITQKLKGNKAGGPMIVWVSQQGMAAPEREGDLVFVRTEGAYAVIRIVGGGFQLNDERLSSPSLEGPTRVAPPGWVIQPKDDFAPVIIDVMAKADIKDLAEFKRLAKDSRPKMDGPLLSYRSMDGDLLTFHTRATTPPTINGEAVDYAPRNVLESPFLSSEYNSGIVTIRHGNRTKVLDFNALIPHP